MICIVLFYIYIFTTGILISSSDINFIIVLVNDFKRESHFFQWHLHAQCRPQWQSISSCLFLFRILIDCTKSIFLNYWCPKHRLNHWCPKHRQSQIWLSIHSNGWRMSSWLFTAAACCSSSCLCPRSTNISCLYRMQAA